MLTKNEFVKILAKEVMETLPDELKENLKVEPVNVVKMNDQKLHGICFNRGDNEPSPTHYVDAAYDDYCEGKNMNLIARELVESFKSSRNERPDVGSKAQEFDFNNRPIALRLLDLKRNREFLKEVPYMDVGNGLALICDLRIGARADGYYSTVINNNVLEIMGKDKATVFREALKEVWNTDAPVLQTMSSKLFGGAETNYLIDGKKVTTDEPMYILSTASGIHGAAALFYPEVQEKISAALSDNYYALPSSTEEFIIVPEKAGIPVEKLTEMVHDANRTVVEPSQVLNDSVYRFDKETGKLKDVSFAREMSSRNAEMRC